MDRHDNDDADVNSSFRRQSLFLQHMMESRNRRNGDTSNDEQIMSHESVSLGHQPGPHACLAQRKRDIRRGSATRVGASLIGLSNHTPLASIEALGLLEECSDGEEEEHSIRFYRNPVQRQKWGEDQMLPHVNWGDLFFDLFYVAAAYNLGVMLIGALTPENWFRGIIYFIAIFGALFNIWESKLVYDARYSVIDYVHRIIEVIRVCFLSLAVVHIKTFDLMTDPNSVEMFSLSLGLLLETLVRMCLKVELILVGKGNIEAIKCHSKRKLRDNYLPTCALYLVAVTISGVNYFSKSDSDADGGHLRMLAGDSSATYGTNEEGWSSSDLPIVFIMAAYTLHIFRNAIKKTCMSPKEKDLRSYTIPINVDFCIHRYGEWVMLMLGESILSLLIVETTESSDYYVVVFVGILTVIVIQTLHFESQPSRETNHALWRNSTSAMFFSLNTQLYSIALIAFGVSFKVMLTAIHTSDTKPDHRRSLWENIVRSLAPSVDVSEMAIKSLFCGSLAITLLSLELMALVHKGTRANLERLFDRTGPQRKILWSFVAFTIFKFVLLAGIATMSAWSTKSFPVYATIGCVITCIFAITRIVGWRMFHKKKKSETQEGQTSDANTTQEHVQPQEEGTAADNDWNDDVLEIPKGNAQAGEEHIPVGNEAMPNDLEAQRGSETSEEKPERTDVEQTA